MAFPFGGHPTLRMFVEWAMQHGCTATAVVRMRANGQSYNSLELTAPSGAQLAIPRPSLDERLAPNTVGNYQRRLGIKGGFAAMPPEPPAEPLPRPALAPPKKTRRKRLS
jgi:hypothetical protein